MVVARRAAGTVATSSAATTISVGWSTNAIGDVALMAVSSSGTVSTPAGWTLINSSTSTASHIYVFWRYLTAAQSGSVSVTTSSSNSKALITTYSGAQSTAPTTDTVAAATPSNTAITSPSTALTDYAYWAIATAAAVSFSAESSTAGSWTPSEATDSATAPSLLVVDGPMGSSATTTLKATVSTSKTAYANIVVPLAALPEYPTTGSVDADAQPAAAVGTDGQVGADAALTATAVGAPSYPTTGHVDANAALSAAASSYEIKTTTGHVDAIGQLTASALTQLATTGHVDAGAALTAAASKADIFPYTENWDSSLGGWSLSAGPGRSGGGYGAHSGNTFLAVGAADGSSASASRTFYGFEVGKRYRVSVWASTDAPTGTSAMPASIYVEVAGLVVSPVPLTHEYQLLTGTFLATQDSLLVLLQASPGSGHVNFDDFSLEVEPDRITVSAGIVGFAGYRLTFPFEDDPYNGFAEVGTGALWRPRFTHSGINSDALGLYTFDQSTGEAQRTLTALTVGRRYRMSAWVIAESFAFSPTVSLGIIGIGSTTVTVPAANHWRQVTFTFVAVAGTQTLSITSNADVNTYGSIWDDFTVDEIGSEAWADAQLEALAESYEILEATGHVDANSQLTAGATSYEVKTTTGHVDGNGQLTASATSYAVKTTTGHVDGNGQLTAAASSVVATTGVVHADAVLFQPIQWLHSGAPAILPYSQPFAFADGSTLPAAIDLTETFVDSVTISGGSLLFSAAGEWPEVGLAVPGLPDATDLDVSVDFKRTVDPSWVPNMYEYHEGLFRLKTREGSPNSHFGAGYYNEIQNGVPYSFRNVGYKAGDQSWHELGLDESAFEPAEGVWYRMRMRLLGGQVSFKIWDRSLSEPDWTVVGNATPYTPHTVELVQIYFDCRAAGTLAVDNLSVSVPSTGTSSAAVKVYNGTAQVERVNKVWNGSAWVLPVTRVWTGADWFPPIGS